MEQTFIQGKDACLEVSIERMQNKLKDSGFKIEQASWLNPVPNIYSVHINDANCPALFTNGKGASRKATFASAMGEFFERLETNYFFSDYYLQPAQQHQWLYYPNEKSFSLEDYRQCLSEKLWALYDENHSLQAEDFLSLNDDAQEVRCLPLIEEKSQQAYYFPMNLLSNLYASNGLCAGNTEVEAKVQGLSEVFERWVKAKILKENLCLPEVPQDILNGYPTIQEAIEKLETMDIAVSVRDASLGGQFPVMNVTLFEQATGRCFASFGAHPIFEVALERTLTESLQGRSLDLLDGFQLPVFDEFLVAEDENIENHFIDSSGLLHAKFISHQYDYDFVAWNFEGDTQQQWQSLVEKVTQQGCEVYSQVYNYADLPAARVIVPGMSEIYPFDELIARNQNVGRQLREMLTQFSSHNLDPDVCYELLEEIDSLGLSDHQGVANLIGLLADKKSLWAKIKVIDLRLALALGAGEIDYVQELVEEASYYTQEDELKKSYSALNFILSAQLEENESFINLDDLAPLFGEQLLRELLSALNGEKFIFELPMGEEIFTSSQSHQQLMKVYQQVNLQKQSYYL